MNRISIEELMHTVNRGEFRKSSIPMELASGWPCIHRKGGCLCMTLPYFFRRPAEGAVAMYPLYCTVTVPVENPGRILDFTIFPLQREWTEADFKRPVGTFPHAALEGMKRTEYNALCKELFKCYDALIASEKEGVPFDRDEEMIWAMNQLMEPCHLAQYRKIDKRFFTRFCTL